ncbi:amidohydrolase family protein [Segetibacter aerophilus]|uniref:Periplasmic amidohydrolase n=1 Tax=Segetibacter aerophilus TaxID=670293 RepID=A0A512BCR4_9BACT|nr:amidohydrolase family protein [Segetibacter aerophilus]GEO09763.1 periplasmic amidohydrolase [Segetibacter aerophilus]
MKKFFVFLLGLWSTSLLVAQRTFPVNGVADERSSAYAFTNATIVKDGQTTLQKATLIIREGKIVAVGTSVSIPRDAIVIDSKDKYIYPSFIDIYSDYGIPAAPRAPAAFDFRAPAQLASNQKGAYNWNQAIKPEVNAANIFVADEKTAKPLRDLGFGTVLTHQKDGIARGTGAVVTLANEKENFVIVKDKASANYSMNKGTSTQSYPSSLMGVIALLRQTYLDGQWYKNKPASEGVNLSLQAWNDNQKLPQIIDASDKWNDIRADRIGDEFGVQYIIKGGGNEYQRIKEVAATKAPFIVSLNFPMAMDVDDPNDARLVSLADMKNWELAPTNPAAFEKAGIPFCLTTADLPSVRDFYTNLRKAIDNGLTEDKALEALTKTPATLLGVYDRVGSLEAGKLANFIITTGPVFSAKTMIAENWVQGDRYNVKEEAWSDVTGIYNLTINSNGNTATFPIDVKSATQASVISKDTLPARISYNGKIVSLSFSPAKRGRSSYRLSGVANGDTWNGNGEDTSGNRVSWFATYSKATTPATDTSKKRLQIASSKVTFPFDGYGWDSLPTQKDLLIKNATVWTNEKEGRLENTDVLVKNGKISQVGKGLTAGAAKVIDGTGKYLTPGIIDEHSHIAAVSINEGAQSVTSEVRIADNLDPEDINIYRQLSGGVTTSHILHGSANTIGGQTQLIKLRWGVDDEGLKFKGADPFIKFALGENVKRTTSTSNNRFPDTRMGVEEVLNDAFARASDYQKALKGADAKNTRRDLELDALVEIMNKKRFITCHSYVQSEITAAMRVGEKYGVRFNTFTHILEGYKVADKMKAHGANASTFSDWWGYKTEVQDAIAYNAAIMNAVGVNVCINSDDAEMARRLNQEAAKSVKYGGMSEEEAFKMVTLNPAKALHVEDRVGSIKTGKDADLVLWSANPLSIYAVAEKTIVDGIVYFDRDRDSQLRKSITAERNRLVQKMLGEKRAGMPTRPAEASYQKVLQCGDHAEEEDDEVETK